jgi:sialate O-acetylesterase
MHPRQLPPRSASALTTFFAANLLFLSAAAVRADVTLPAFFSDHLVLQRDLPAPVWGTAAPGEKVAVEFADQSLSTTAGPDGRWLVRLAPLPASATARILTIRGANTITVGDVLVGDVWLASGQSNMDSPLSSGSAAQALPDAADPLLRFFKIAKSVAAEPRSDLKGKWEVSTPDTAKNFSAVAYFFAKEIRRTQGVPVAVFNDAWGGTPIKTWMPLASLRSGADTTGHGPAATAAPALAKTLAEWEKALVQHRAVKDRPELMDAYYADMKDWETNVQPRIKAAKAAGQPAPADARPEPVAPDPIAMPSASKRPSTPTISYNAMIAPLAPYGLRGVLWYQGEADVSRGLEYRELFPALIQGWRTVWGQGELPFLFVQLPGHGKDAVPVAAQSNTIPWLREAQARALALPATGMAVTLDIGDAADVHPDNKLHTGRRLALVAREKVYGEKITGTGPLYHDHVVSDSTIRIRFTSAGTGLVIGEAPWRPANAAPWPKDKLVGFHLAGADRKWVEAEARIEGDAVVVSAASVPAPVAVRYGWAGSPAVNLYNREGLPAAPFRTDDWPR